MGVPVHRPLLPLFDEYELKAIDPMGIYTGKAPQTCSPFVPLSREQQLEMHCAREARREVECWFIGTVYHWEPFCYREGLRYVDIQGRSRPIQPLQLVGKR